MPTIEAPVRRTQTPEETVRGVRPDDDTLGCAVAEPGCGAPSASIHASVRPMSTSSIHVMFLPSRPPPRTRQPVRKQGSASKSRYDASRSSRSDRLVAGRDQEADNGRSSDSREDALRPPGTRPAPARLRARRARWFRQSRMNSHPRPGANRSASAGSGSVSCYDFQTKVVKRNGRIRMSRD